MVIGIAGVTEGGRRRGLDSLGQKRGEERRVFVFAGSNGEEFAKQREILTE